MDIHAGERPELTGHGRGETIVQPRRRHAHDDDLAAQRVGLHAPFEDVVERQRRIGRRVAAERDQVAALAGRVVRQVVRMRAGRTADRMQLAALDRAIHGHHQLWPAHAAVAFVQRHAAYDAVGVDFEVDVTEPDRTRRERGHRRVDRARAVRLLGAQQHGQEGRHVGHCIRERAIFRRRFGKQHVIDDGGRLRARQRVEQPRMHVTRPRPAAERGHALVVDIDDDHVG